MNSPALDQDEEKPLDPAVEKVRKRLVRFIAINLGLLFVALMAVALAVVYKSRTADPAAPRADLPSEPHEPAAEGRIELPPGTEIMSQSLSGSRISLLTRGADGKRSLLVYDTSERRVVARIEVSP